MKHATFARSLIGDCGYLIIWFFHLHAAATACNIGLPAISRRSSAGLIFFVCVLIRLSFPKILAVEQKYEGTPRAELQLHAARRVEAAQDLIWALLNSRDFVLTH